MSAQPRIEHTDDSTETRVAVVRRPLTRADIEQMKVGVFADHVVALAVQGGDEVATAFRIARRRIGLWWVKSIPLRWQALAELCQLYAIHNQADSEIEAIRVLFVERLVDEELKLHPPQKIQALIARRVVDEELRLHCHDKEEQENNDI